MRAGRAWRACVRGLNHSFCVFRVILASTMELKATSLLLLTSIAIIIIISAEGGTSVIPQCCLVVSKKIPREMLHAVWKIDVQSRSGRCEIDALILHVRDRKICAHPKLRQVLEKLKKLKKLKTKPRKDRKPK